MSKEGIRNKQRPFRLLRYLFENTDEEHPVTTSELVEIFQAEDAHASRKTVKDDIDILVKEGFDIITVRSTQNSFFFGSRSLEVPELKLLIDAVSSCRFISKEKSAVLIDKLKKMTSRGQADKLTRHMYVADRLKADNHQLLYIVDTITDAINAGTKIRFQYFDYNASKERFLRHGGAEYIVSPYALLWDDNNYYTMHFYGTTIITICAPIRTPGKGSPITGWTACATRRGLKSRRSRFPRNSISTSTWSTSSGCSREKRPR